MHGSVYSSDTDGVYRAAYERAKTELANIQKVKAWLAIEKAWLVRAIKALEKMCTVQK